VRKPCVKPCIVYVACIACIRLETGLYSATHEREGMIKPSAAALFCRSKQLNHTFWLTHRRHQPQCGVISTHHTMLRLRTISPFLLQIGVLLPISSGMFLPRNYSKKRITSDQFITDTKRATFILKHRVHYAGDNMAIWLRNVEIKALMTYNSMQSAFDINNSS